MGSSAGQGLMRLSLPLCRICSPTFRLAGRRPVADVASDRGDLENKHTRNPGCGLPQDLSSPIDRLRQIVLVQLNAHEIQTELGGGDRSASQAKKWIHCQPYA